MADDDPTSILPPGAGVAPGGDTGARPRRQIVVPPPDSSPPDSSPSDSPLPGSPLPDSAPRPSHTGPARPRQVSVGPTPAAPAAPAAPLATAGRGGGGGASLPPPADLQPDGQPGRGGRLRRRWRVGRSGVALAVVGVLVLLVVAPLVFGWWQFSRIERVDVGPVLSPAGAGTNYLVVGSDSRELVDPAGADAGAFLAAPVAGERADTIIVLRVGDGPARMLSIPRDLWVTYPSTGEEGRINGAFAQGPGELIATVEGLGIPISHYLQIDFTSFAGLVDAVGGVSVTVPHPAYDEMSGLAIDGSGEVTLDGAQAVAYVRSRQYTEIIDGVPVTDPTGDIGRTARQRAFLAALFSKMGSTRNPFAAGSAASALAPGLAIDDTMTFLDALRLGWDVRSLSSESVELPVDPFTTSGGAAVLSLRQPDAGAVLAGFG